MKVKVHLRDPELRKEVDLRAFEDDIDEIIEKFKMVKFIEITERDFTININAKEIETKDRTLRTFGYSLAKETAFRMFIKSENDAWQLFIEKNI